MAKTRRRISRVERGTRAKPQRKKLIQRLVKKPVEEIKKIQPIPQIFWNMIVKQNKEEKKARKKIPLKNLMELSTSPCKAKKADARHNYFSMRKSGRGATRTNPKTDRFNSRC